MVLLSAMDPAKGLKPAGVSAVGTRYAEWGLRPGSNPLEILLPEESAKQLLVPTPDP